MSHRLRIYARHRLELGANQEGVAADKKDFEDIRFLDLSEIGEVKNKLS